MSCLPLVMFPVKEQRTRSLSACIQTLLQQIIVMMWACTAEVSKRAYLDTHMHGKV